MKKILIVSHGTLAKGNYEAAKMFFGELTNVIYLCLEENMGIEDYKKKLTDVIQDISGSEQIVVLSDIKGGSPYNSVVSILSEKGLLKKSKILTGLNLIMLISVLMIENEITEKEVIDIIATAREGIINFKIEDKGQDEDTI
ncbi:hypothetical protein G9F72_003715 [Clostridium estertheticum]|uniref:PTS sugar transporter subunit IIA n=1 Tax=Clostridium estertheticum TaxID=238834 RepID=UPI0013E99CA5|nr:hypothetical protein [Clostridium estertheticum]MBZ9685459.1 hypothetical protein [Clostridium estertheticum]